jgi:predicted metal-binding membrane protein
MTFDMAPAAFMGMWATMMVAMMLPSIAPRALAYTHGHMPVAITGAFVAFLAVYFVAWAVTGVPALVAVTALSHVGRAGAWLERAGGAMLVVAGAYQFTRWKQASIRGSRISFRAATSDAARGGPGAAARAGLSHGLSCLRCCWALIAVLLVVGVMNLAWMVAITLICLGETNRRYGAVVTNTVGVALIALGLAVLVYPAFLAELA